MLPPTELTYPIRLYRPWPARFAGELLDALRRLATQAATRLAQARERRRERQAWLAALELGERTLRDMGAPDWLQARAQACRESRRLERRLIGIEPRRDVRHFR